MARYESDWREMEAKIQELETALEIMTQERDKLHETAIALTRALSEAVELARKRNNHA